MLGLLNATPNETVNFIVSFTNRAVEYFAETDLGKSEVEEIEVRLTDEAPVKQYVCNRIWNLYRGTQVAPVVLESIHMALERWLLGVAKHADAELLEAWCLHMIRGSRSASITGIVASVVLAEPNKLFNVAKVLFRTKELFLYDASRMQLDQSAKSTLGICHDPTGMHRNERLRTCDDKHRKGCLEHLALRYQVFRTDGESEELVKGRQETIWKIFDEHYANVPDRASETDADKTWRLFLARMDRRKMSITTEEKDDQVYISFNPDIEPELKQYSEDALARGAASMKHLSLNLWAQFRFERNEGKYKEYPQYENDIKSVIAETKTVINGLNARGSDDGSFVLFYRATPAYVCAVLIRDKFELLDAAEREFCKDVVLKYAAMPFSDEYSYQVSDGVGPATQVLPRLIKSFPHEAKLIKRTLLFGLFNERSVGMAQSFSQHAISAVLDTMWGDFPAEANSLFLGYVLLKPKFDVIRESVVNENRKKGIFQFSEAALRKQFEKSNEKELESVFDNTIGFDQLPAAVNTASERILVTGFTLLPLQTENELHKEFVRVVCRSLSERLLTDDREDRFDYTVRHRFFDKFAEFVLFSEKGDFQPYVEPFLKGFRDSREVASLLGAFVSAENKLHQYEQFWAIWELFYPSVKALCERGDRRLYSPDVVHTYFLAWPYWNETAKEWRSLKTRERAFFKRAAEEIGGHPAVLYSLAKLLNEIGSSFKEDGLAWISGIIERTPELSARELEVNTIYYLENLLRGFLLQNRHKVRTVRALRNQVLTILNFLLEKGSATAYLLREDILS